MFSLVEAPSGEKGRRGSVNRLLPVLSVFSEWASRHPTYLLALPVPTPHSQPSSSASVFASPDLLRDEARARSGMRAAFSSLKDFFATAVKAKCIDSALCAGWAASEGGSSSSSSSSSNGDGIAHQPLQEHIMLRGFLPLQHYDVSQIKLFLFLFCLS